MEQVTLETIQTLAEQVKEQIDVIYLHWSAGHYNNLDADYHVNITGDGRIFISTENFATKLAHTWHRNTGSIGVAICACAFATTENLGDASACDRFSEDYMNREDVKMAHEPPTNTQLTVMAQVIKALCNGLGFPIDYNHVRTHCEQAEIDAYGPSTTCERWDLAILRQGGDWMNGGNELRAAAIAS